MAPQDAIQCYTQNQIAGAAQATGRDARGIEVVGEDTGAARHAFEQDGGARRGGGGDGLFARNRGGAKHQGGDGRHEWRRH